MFDFRQQNIINSQKQEAYILEKSHDQSKDTPNKWNKNRRMLIIVLLVIVFIIYLLSKKG